MSVDDMLAFARKLRDVKTEYEGRLFVPIKSNEKY